MRVSEFWQAVTDEFGEQYGRAITRDLILSEFDSSATDAVSTGHDTREVWLALCRAADVPIDRRHGVGHLPRD